MGHQRQGGKPESPPSVSGSPSLLSSSKAFSQESPRETLTEKPRCLAWVSSVGVHTFTVASPLGSETLAWVSVVLVFGPFPTVAFSSMKKIITWRKHRSSVITLQSIQP